MQSSTAKSIRTNRVWLQHKPILSLILLIVLALLAVLFIRKQSPVVKQLAPTQQAVDHAREITHLHTLDAAIARFCSWSSDGRIVKTLGQVTPTQNDALQHWDVASGELISTSLPYCAPDRDIAGVAALSNTINIVDVRTGQILRQLEPSIPPNEIVSSQGVTTTILFTSSAASPLLWSTQGRMLVTTTNGATGSAPTGSGVVSVQLWDATTGLRHSYVNIADFPALLQQYVVSPDTTILAASYMQYGPNSNYLSVEIWDLYTAKRKGTVNIPYSSSKPMFWSPDSRTLAVVTDGRQVTLVNAATAEITMKLPEDLPGEYTPTPFTNPDPVGTTAGTLAPVPQETSEAAAPPPVRTFAPPGYIPPVTPVALLPGADANDYQIIGNVVWSPDGSTIATYDRSYIRLWDITSGKLKAIARHPYSLCDRIWPMRWSADGRLLATIDCDEGTNVLRLWDGFTAAPLRELTTNVYDFHWSPSVDRPMMLIEHVDELGTELWGHP
jgi:WD40 repeat protein